MRLVVFSYKPCWTSAESASGFATDGGFPFQMAALSKLFDQTTLVLPLRAVPAPRGLRPLVGHRLSVEPLPEPLGRGFRRKMALLTWLPRRLPALWRAVGRADAIHAVVPGDLGSLGIPLALARKKRLFVRHCGTWGHPVTVADRFLYRVLRRIAANRHPIFATGGGGEPPEPGLDAIRWIFSSSLTDDEVGGLEPAATWNGAQAPRLISVGRLTRGKNAASTLRALLMIRRRYPGATLEVLGEGPELQSLKRLATDASLNEAVRFHGNVSHEEVLVHLRTCHLLVFPTRVAEGFPKAVLEAMACGVPVLAPRVSVLPELLSQGRGFLLDDTTPEAIASAVERALADPDALRSVAVAARRHVSGLTLERWRDAIGQDLEEVWGEPTRSRPEDRA